MLNKSIFSLKESPFFHEKIEMPLHSVGWFRGLIEPSQNGFGQKKGWKKQQYGLAE